MSGDERQAMRAAVLVVGTTSTMVGITMLLLTLAARSHGLLRALDARVTANAVVGAVETLVFLALSGEDLGTPEEASAALIELMLHGVATAV